MKDIYTENYKAVLKKIKEDTNIWKDPLCSWIERLHIVRLPILSKVIYKFNVIPIKIPVAIFLQKYREKLVIKFILNLKEPEINKTILKKNKVGELTLPDFKTLQRSYSNRNSEVLA